MRNKRRHNDYLNISSGRENMRVHRNGSTYLKIYTPPLFLKIKSDSL